MKRSLLFVSAVIAGCPAPRAEPAVGTTALGNQLEPAESSSSDAGPNLPQKPARLEVALGRELSCARVERRVHCWPLGEPEKPITKIPAVPGIEDAIAIAVASEHACALGANGSVRCWGDNERGELGAGLADEKVKTPVSPIGVEGATKLACSGATCCAIVKGGAVTCWGDNRYGQTGSDVMHTEDTNDLVVPTRVPSISGASEISVAGTASCARTPSGVWCWGVSDLQSEKEARGKQSPEPSKLTELAGVTAITGNQGIFCGIGRGGELSCWGDSADDLEVGQPARHGTVASFGLRNVVLVGNSESHVCALFATGRLSCLGVGFNGVLGRGVLEEDLEAQPVAPVKGVKNVRSLALSGQTTCAVTHEDELWCWGLLPIGPNTAANLSAEPVRIPVW